MRIFLRPRRAPETFAQVLDSVLRTAGVNDGDHSLLRARTRRDAATRVEPMGAPHRGRPSSASLDSYREHRAVHRTPRTMKPSDPQSVAAELAIATHMTLADLARLRRTFARANHPDRVTAPERENATRRMMIANMLIDREMKRRLTRGLSSP
jgi:hypothetical protein